MKRIIFSGPDGIAAVLIPAYVDEVTGMRGNETEEEYLARVIARNHETGELGPATIFKIVDEAEIPVRHYRNAWRFDGTAIKHDMAVARRMKLDEEIRPERNQRLAKKDVEFSRALATGNQATEDSVEASRQALRDLPETVQPTLDAITDPVALKAF